MLLPRRLYLMKLNSLLTYSDDYNDRGRKCINKFEFISSKKYLTSEISGRKIFISQDTYHIA